MTWLGAAFGEWRDRSLLAGDAVGCWEGSNVMCGGPPAWVRFGRGGKVPVRERGWKFSLVLWTVAGHATLAGVWCNGLKPETRRKRVWQDPMVLLYQWGLGQQTHFTSRCLWRPKQITSYLQGSQCLVFALFFWVLSSTLFLRLELENCQPWPLHQWRIRFRMLEEGQEAVVASQQMAYKLKDSWFKP